MTLLNQKTVKESVNFSGVGLHSGKIVNLCIKPSDPNTGIVFKRVDLKTNNIVYPDFSNVSNTSLNTTISNEHGIKISTIEHLMGALFGLGVDNALIEIDNEEVPILDGSAQEFINKITVSGFKKSDAPIKIVKIEKKVTFRDGERFISIVHDIKEGVHMIYFICHALILHSKLQREEYEKGISCHRFDIRSAVAKARLS